MSFRIIHGIILKLKKISKNALEFSGRYCKNIFLAGHSSGRPYSVLCFALFFSYGLFTSLNNNKR